MRNSCHDQDEIVHADPDRMQQVLGNLLDNALRHTPAGGTVEIGCRRGSMFIDIDITDSGEGMPPEELDTVFQRFHRLDDSRGRGAGSGLGLTIARAIVQDHGGRLTAVSEGPTTGTKLTISLPAVR